MENAGQGQIGWPREETVPERDWKPGMVLRSYVCERCNPVRGGTPFVHELRHNCWVYAKPRLVVVVIKCHFFAVVPPVYTHLGRGLRGKPDREFVQVRDHRTATFVDMTQPPHRCPHQPLITAYMDAAARHIDPLDCVQIVRPICVGYDVPVAKVGNLRDTFKRELQYLYRSYVP